MSADAPLDSAGIYDAFAPHYREYSQKKTPYLQGIDRLIAERFRGRVGSLLDFGAGDGVRGAALSRMLEARSLVQADVSGEMVQRCRSLGAAREVWDLKQAGWQDRPERFDLIVCLWNVLGHVPSQAEREATLLRLRGLLSPSGALCFDVNNRHNARYGRLRILWRRLVDAVAFDPARGDATFDWVIGGRTYPAHGHLFTRREVDGLLAGAGLRPTAWWAVDYDTGEVSTSVTRGHLLFIAEGVPREPSLGPPNPL